ncbi:hypothetical protein MSG28_016203 [Choristoneura fumiferana]|uniref:Uncharacterized protein n=1 Tax=Choristoneura fumiferana TaxID=7141 RepID=A0ACC0K5R5_CHOFU|nr:hypothetical protein MSG28_016203 [Choristoneura fumiferana]
MFCHWNIRLKPGLDIREVSALSACLDPEGQRLFLAIARVIEDVSWAGQNIRVYNEVTISPPYKVENVIGEPDSKPYNYIRKFVERHWSDRDHPSASNSQLQL